MTQTSILNGITHSGKSEIKNPNDHSPMGMRNRVIIDRYTPDGEGGSVLAQRVVQKGNIMCSIGLDVLNNLLATSALAFTATNGWVQTGAVGTSTTVPTFNDTALNALTASVHISDGAGDMLLADAGARTLEYQMTFDDALAYTINEVGLFASSLPINNCVAHSTSVSYTHLTLPTKA